MKAVCDLTQIPTYQTEGPRFAVPPLMCTFLGKPFVQHVIEYIERLGIGTIALYLSSYADDIERLLGDGERWGLTLEYHLVKQGESVAERVIHGGLEPDERYLFCNARSLPLLSAGQLGEEDVRFTAADGRDTGWSWSTLEAFAAGEQPESRVETVLSIDDGERYRASLATALQLTEHRLITIGRQLKPGIWTGPGVKIAPSARIIPPVFIDRMVSIGEEAVIGPVVELGAGSIVDSGSYVTESTVLPGSYIGKDLDIKQSIVNQHQILRTELKTVYSAVDDILLSPVDFIDSARQGSPVPLLSRVWALLLALPALPLQLLLVLFALAVRRRYRTFSLGEFVPIPQSSENFGSCRRQNRRVLFPREVCSGSPWRLLLLHVVPGLWSVVGGKRRFFGLPLKESQEFDALSDTWKGLYLRSRPGLVSEADILYPEYPDDMTLFAAEMYYSVNDSLRYNVRLCGKFVKALFSGRRG